MLPLDPRERATSTSQSDEPLPLLRGINASTLQPGRRLAAPQVQAALQFIVAFEQSPMAGLVDLKRVDVSSPEVLVVTTGQGSEVTFGLTDFEQQLRRWHAIFESGRRRSAMRSPRSILPSPTIFPSAGSRPAPFRPRLPKSPKPLRPKKKHV